MSAVTLARPGTWYGYRGSLTDPPEPERPPERVLAALAALGDSGTVAEVRRFTEAAGAALSGGYTALLLRQLARRDPPAVTVTGSDKGGAGRERHWHLYRCPGCGYLPQARGHQEKCGKAVAA